MKTSNFNVKLVNFNKIKHIYFIGIGGISVSGLAKFCINKGVLVSGSDLTESHLTKELQSLGAKVFAGHNQNNIKLWYSVSGNNIGFGDENNDGYNESAIVVYSGAIANSNPELVFANNNNIIAIERSIFLGLVASTFKNVISVSGTHGKTTTTALIGNIFIKAGLNPTIHLGGEIANSYNNFLIGENEYFITEACEYKKSFESLHSTHSVITNIGKDHMDCYDDENDVFNSFNTFANQTKEVVVANSFVADKISTTTNTVFCGLDDNGFSNYTAKNIVSNKFGKHSFSVFKGSEKVEGFTLNITGKYNVYNALYAIVIGIIYGIDISIIKSAINEFEGIKRRNEFMGEFCGVPVFADYAHHPTEIEESLSNYKNIYKNVLLVFQPHTYSRTKTLLSDFENCFINANSLIMFKTYPAREKYDFAGSENHLFNSINFNKNNKKLVFSLERLPDVILESLGNNSVVLFLGAGDLYNYIESVIK